MNYNRGQFGNLVTIVLILAGAIVLYMFIALYSEKASAEEYINVCKLSVISQSASKLPGGALTSKSPVDIECHKRYVEFYNDHVGFGMSPEGMKPLSVVYGGQKTKRFKSLTDNVVNQVIAEEMRVCKYQFADGKIEIFANNEKFFGDDNICFVCSEIGFNDIEPKKITSFLEYTNNTKLKNIQQTYYAYFTERVISNNPMWLQPYYYNPFSNYSAYSDLSFDTNKRYSVFIKKNGAEDRPYPDNIWGIDPSSVKIFNEVLFLRDISEEDADTWEDDEMVTIAIVPSDHLNYYCNIQAN